MLVGPLAFLFSTRLSTNWTPLSSLGSVSHVVIAGLSSYKCICKSLYAYSIGPYILALLLGFEVVV